MKVWTSVINAWKSMYIELIACLAIVKSFSGEASDPWENIFVTNLSAGCLVVKSKVNHCDWMSDDSENYSTLMKENFASHWRTYFYWASASDLTYPQIKLLSKKIYLCLFLPLFYTILRSTVILTVILALHKIFSKYQ
jgi:hypothetical protein